MRYMLIKELQGLIKDKRLYLFVIIVAVTSICSGVISSHQYETQQEEYIHLSEKYFTDLKNNCRISLQKVSDMNHLVLKSPHSSLFLSGSESLNFPNKSEIDISNLSIFGRSDIFYPKRSIKNELTFSEFIRYDMTFIIEVLFSFMVIFLTHNIISKENEMGTLRLLLSTNISRINIINGKILSYLMLAILSVFIGVLFQLITINYLGKIQIGSNIYSEIFILLIYTILYLLFWIILSTLMSVICSKSYISLTILLIIWISSTMIVPSSVKIIANQFTKHLPSSKEISMHYIQIENELWATAQKNGAAWRGGNLGANARDNHIKEKKLAPIYLNYLNVLNKYQYSLVQLQINQLKFLYDYSSISPSILFRRLSESIFGVGIEREYMFLNDIQRFRSTLMASIQKLDNEDKDSYHLAFLPKYMSQKPINHESIPRFIETTISPIKLFINNWVLAVVLLLQITSIYFFCNYKFIRMNLK